MHGLAGVQVELNKIAARMDEDRSRSDQLLENEPFPAKKSSAELFHERHAQLHRGLCKQEGIALRHDALARRQIERLNAARIASGKPDFARAISPEVGQEQRLARDRAL